MKKYLQIFSACAFFVLLASLPAANAANCYWGDGACNDFCHNETPQGQPRWHCGSNCTPCKAPNPPKEPEGGVCLTLQISSATLTMNSVYSAPPTGFWTVGNKYGLSLATSAATSVQNHGTWGEGTDSGLVPSAIGAVIRLEQGSAANLRKIVVESLDLRIPSFAHSKIAPATTGENVFSLDTYYNSVGEVNITTGVINYLIVRAKMTNTYFLPEAPAKTVIQFSGSINPSALTASLNFEGQTFNVD